MTSILFLLTGPVPAQALTPAEVLVIANMNAASSKGLALYYMKKRKIPRENLVLLWMTDKETCTREAYEKKAIPPIRRFLAAHPDIRALVTLYGVPLRISSPGNLPGEDKRLQNLRAKKEKAQADLKKAEEMKEEELGQIKKTLNRINTTLTGYKRSLDRTASFDSELSLVKKEAYELKMWLPNPFYPGFKNHHLKTRKSEVMMTSRLDGASPQVVKRVINDSIYAERHGLHGNAYFDARWKDPGDKSVSGYAFYDKSIHKAAQFHRKNKILPVILNDTPDLFKPGECKEAALYCGWYKLANYIDAFEWVKGSVGYHIASSECATLKNPRSNVWCKKMLDNGIAATIGPVGEPYVQAFPVPEVFFQLLTEGYLTLAEAYTVAIPYLSWKMVLVGDPLYRVHMQKEDS